MAAYLEHIGGERFPDQLSLVLRKERDLPVRREPPPGAVPSTACRAARTRSLADAEQVQGPQPTFNDLIDLDAGLRIVIDFASPTCAIVKQRNPVGLASHDDGREAYRRALSGDPVTAYGAVVAFNREVDEALARELVLNPFEGVVAAGYSARAPGPSWPSSPSWPCWPSPRPLAEGLPDHGIAALDFQRIEGGLLVETRDTLDIDHAQLNVVTQRRPTLEELTDLMFAWRAVRHITSLAVVVAKSATLVGRRRRPVKPPHRHRDRAPPRRRAGAAQRARLRCLLPIRRRHRPGCRAGRHAPSSSPAAASATRWPSRVADRHHLAMVFTGRRHFRH